MINLVNEEDYSANTSFALLRGLYSLMQSHNGVGGGYALCPFLPQTR